MRRRRINGLIGGARRAPRRPVGAGREDDQSGVKEGRRAGATGTRRWAVWTIRESCAERRNPNAREDGDDGAGPRRDPGGERGCRCRPGAGGGGAWSIGAEGSSGASADRSAGRPRSSPSRARRPPGRGVDDLGRRGHAVDRRRRCRRRSRARCSADLRGATGTAPGSGARGPATAARPRRRGPRGRGRRSRRSTSVSSACGSTRTVRSTGRAGPAVGRSAAVVTRGETWTTGAAAVRTVSVTARTG